MTLDWRDGGKAPFEMIRGAAVVDGNVAYFLHEYMPMYVPMIRVARNGVSFLNVPMNSAV
jgi:hypothetical protein